MVHVSSAPLPPSPRSKAPPSSTPSPCPKAPPSHEEKRSGEPSQISWASAQFCSSVKTFYAKCTQKRYGYSSRDKNFTVVREVLRNNYQSCNLIGPYRFWGENPRYSTLFTRPFLTGRRVWAGDETNPSLPLCSHTMHEQSMNHTLPEKGRPNSLHLNFQPAPPPLGNSSHFYNHLTSL